VIIVSYFRLLGGGFLIQEELLFVLIVFICLILFWNYYYARYNCNKFQSARGREPGKTQNSL